MNLYIKLVCLSIAVSFHVHAMQNVNELGKQLLVAAGDSDYHEAERLIKAGAPVNYLAENYDMTIMQRAIEYTYQKKNSPILYASSTALALAIYNNEPAICNLFINAMLWIPTSEQKARMITLFGIDKFRKNICPYGLDANLRNEFRELWHIIVYENNKDNFATSIAYQEIMRIKDLPYMQDPECKKLIAALLEKYNAKAATTSSQSWRSLQ
jgi:hypothetical protein